MGEETYAPTISSLAVIVTRQTDGPAMLFFGIVGQVINLCVDMYQRSYNTPPIWGTVSQMPKA